MLPVCSHALPRGYLLLTIESRLPFAIALPLLTLVIGNTCEEHRSMVATRSLAIRAAKKPDQVPVHRSVIWPEAIYQRMDVELDGLAAHSMPAIYIEAFARGQRIGEGLRHPLKRSVCQVILPSIFIGLWISRRFGKCSGCTSSSVILI